LDGGKSWPLQGIGTVAYLVWSLLILDGIWFIDRNTGTIVGSKSTILRTIDGGETWTAQASGCTAALRRVCCIDALSGTAAGIFGTILHTTIGGVTW